MSGFTEPLVNGFLLGLSTGPMCMMGCLPALMSITLGQSSMNDARGTWLFIGKFITGRFFAYLAFGLVVGFLGSRLDGLTSRVGVIAWMVMAIILIAYGLGFSFGHIGLCRVAGRFVDSRYFPFIMGALMGLNLCPPFLLAITYTLERSANMAFGVLFFMAFFVSTSLYILPAGFAGHLGRQELFARAGKIASVVVGAVFLYQGVTIMMVG